VTLCVRQGGHNSVEGGQEDSKRSAKEAAARGVPVQLGGHTAV
jgi:hypothetical protein